MYQYMILVVFLATAVAGVSFEIVSMLTIWLTDRRAGRPKLWAYRLADLALALLGLSLVELGFAVLAGSDEGLLGLVGLGIVLASIIGGIAAVIWASQISSSAVALDDIADWEFFAQEARRQEVIVEVPDLGNLNNNFSKSDKEVMN